MRKGSGGMKEHRLAPWLCGAAAGLANGFFGAGGGMLLLPLLSKTTDLKQHELFACSVCIILPLSLVSAGVYLLRGGSFLTDAVPYLIGGVFGGAIAGLTLRKLPTKWLHRALGVFILWGGIRLLIR